MKKTIISNIVRSAFITGSIITVLIISQLNWAYDHKYYEDIVLRIVVSVVLGIILGAFYLWLLYTNFRCIINIMQNYWYTTNEFLFALQLTRLPAKIKENINYSRAPLSPLVLCLSYYNPICRESEFMVEDHRPRIGARFHYQILLWYNYRKDKLLFQPERH